MCESLRSFLLPCASRPRNIGTYVFTATWKTLLYITRRFVFFNEQRNRDDAAKKRANTSGVGESNNYYEDIYNIPYSGYFSRR